MKNCIINNKGFSMIELLVSIIIIIILGSISFLGLQFYTKNARDASRLSDVNELKTFLNLYALKTGNYPLPDNNSQINYSGSLLRVQGVIGNKVIMDLGEKANKKPIDPLYQGEFLYSVTSLKNEYEILALYESAVVLNNKNIINNKANALNTFYPKIEGTYNKLFIKTSNYVVPTPSIITSEPLVKGEIMNLNSGNITSQIISDGNNIPFVGTLLGQTGALNINLSVYQGYINEKSSNSQKEDLAKKLQGAYTGSTLSNYGKYQTILEKSTQEELVNLVNYYIFNTEGLH